MIDCERSFAVQTPRAAHEHHGDVGKYLPVAMLVGVGQIRPGHVAANFHQLRPR